MPKRNRDILNDMCMYDMLMMMNSRITNDSGALGVDLCIMNGLLEYGQTVERCRKYCLESFRSGCDECIREWLNEFPF